MHVEDTYTKRASQCALAKLHLFTFQCKVAIMKLLVTACICYMAIYSCISYISYTIGFAESSHSYIHNNASLYACVHVYSYIDDIHMATVCVLVCCKL